METIEGLAVTVGLIIFIGICAFVAVKGWATGVTGDPPAYPSQMFAAVQELFRANYGTVYLASIEQYCRENGKYDSSMTSTAAQEVAGWGSPSSLLYQECQGKSFDELNEMLDQIFADYEQRQQEIFE